METSTPKILIVEDNEELREILRRNLEQNDYIVHQAGDGESGLRTALQQVFDVIILDAMLPKISGFDVCAELRQKGCSTPILFLSARADDVDKVVGLDSGADDYLTKPFSVAELLARIRALLRRKAGAETSASSQDELLKIGALTIDKRRRKVHLSGEEVHITATEFDLLCFLASNAGRPFSRNELLDMIWEDANMVTEHSVNSMMRRLRLKIEPDPSNPTYLLTARGIGYRFVEQQELDNNQSSE